MSSRERLLDAGLRLMQNRGYQSTGISEILADTGLPKGSFYHYFASKDDFTREVIERYSKQESDRCARLLTSGGGSPLVRLRRYFKELMKVFGPEGSINGCLVGRMSLDGATRSELLQQQLKLSFQNWQRGVESCLREAQSEGEASMSMNATSMAAFIVNNWEGALLRSQADHSDDSLKTFMHYTFGELLK